MDHIRATGEMPFFYAPLERKFPLVASRDIGLAGAKVLQETWTGERVLEVDGPQGGTDLLEAAAAFGGALGREVKAVELPEAALAECSGGYGHASRPHRALHRDGEEFQLRLDPLR